MNNIHHPMGFILLDLFCPEETQQNKLHPRSFRSSRMVCVVVLGDYYSAVLFPPESEESEQTVFRSWGVNCCSRWGSFCSRFILLFCFLWFQKKQKKQRTGYLFCSWWCVVACEFYSAVLILTVPEQSEQSPRGLVCVLPLRARSSGWWFLLGSFILLF